MSFEHCMAAMSKALGRRITMEEGEAFAERLEAERIRQGGGQFPADYLKAASAIAEAESIAKARARMHVMLNKQTWQRLNAFAAAADTAGVPASLAIEAKRVGVNTPFQGGRESVAALHETIRDQSYGAVIADLREPLAPGQAPLLDYFTSREFELELIKAARKDAGADPRAVAIYESLDRQRESQRKRENRAGSGRGRLDGFATKHHWDPRRVEKAGLDEFRRDMLAELDPERTFNPDDGLQTQLASERNMVDRQISDAAADLARLAATLTKGEPYVKPSLKAASRLADETSANRAARASEVAGEVSEGRRAMGGALQRYMDLAARERALGGLSPLEAGSTEAHGKAQAGAKRAGDARMEARVALNREHYRLQKLHERYARATGKSEEAQAKAAASREAVEGALAEMDLIERGLDGLRALEDRMGDLQKTLRGAVVDQAGFLEAAFKNITTNQWRKAEGARFEGVVSMSGPGNVAQRRANAHRVFHFKTAEGELRLLRKYSDHSLAESIMSEFDHNARVIALLEEFGPNPVAMHDRWVESERDKAVKRGDTAEVKRLTAKSIGWQMAEITGQTRSVHSELMAKWAGGIRAVQTMAKLGGALVSSFADVATMASEIRYQGGGLFEGYGSALAGLVKGRRADEQRKILDLLGVGFETLTGQVLSRVTGNDSVPGFLSRKMQQFFRLNLLGWWTDSHKSTAALWTAREFAGEAEKDFGALGREHKRLLGLYGIDQRGWDILRKHGIEKDEAGVAFLTGEGARRAPLDAFWNLATDRDTNVITPERVILQARDRLASQWGALIKDRTDFAIATPGARERALMNMGTERGTWNGEALRFLMQFKSFPLALQMRVLGREMYGHGPGPKLGAVARVGATIAELTVLGFVALEAKEMLKGREPRPVTPETVMAAMVQGGGLGIYGDFLFGEFNRFGRSALATAAGPTFGAVDDLLEIWSRARAGEDAAAQSLRFAVSNTPFLNLFYVKPALDWFVLWPLSEKMNPGWARRNERRVEKDNGNTYWLRPTEAVR